MSTPSIVQAAEEALTWLEGARWAPGRNSSVKVTGGPVTSFGITWDGEPVSGADLDFVAHAPADVAHLLVLLPTGPGPTAQTLRPIRQRAEAATAGPWRAVLASTPGIAGSSMIQAPVHDMYLNDPDGNSPPEPYFRFIAWARAGIPELLEHVLSEHPGSRP